MPDTATDARALDPRRAWERYRPTADDPWDLRKAGHLYRRAGFGASLTELREAVRVGPDAAIEQLLRGGPEEAFERQMQSLVPGLESGNNGQLATAWWLYRMAYSPHPLREKLTLFWHDHFATSNLKVNNVRYMLGQYRLLRRHALGRFRALLLEITEDPAMMVWLDTVQSRRGQPNENYARELMELFSLGIRDYRRPERANYTEQDIREAARAFTGYRVENDRPAFRPELHDDTEKTVLGRRGRWRGPDVVRICLEQPNCPYFIAGKLFRFLVADTLPAPAALIEPLAEELRRNDYDVAALVERILRSNLFFSAHAYRAKIKSPVEFAVGIVRGLEGRVGTTNLGTALEGLGQRLFYPPSVAGWDEGEAWLNGQTLLFRHNLALALTSTQDDRFGRRCDPAALARRQNVQGDGPQVDLFADLFLQGDLPADERDRLVDYLRQSRRERTPVFWTAQDAEDQRTRALCHLVLTLPEFQLS